MMSLLARPKRQQPASLCTLNSLYLPAPMLKPARHAPPAHLPKGRPSRGEPSNDLQTRAPPRHTDLEP
jgi:hypothetical protein